MVWETSEKRFWYVKSICLKSQLKFDPNVYLVPKYPRLEEEQNELSLGLENKMIL